MIRIDAPVADVADLERRIWRQIEQRTFGRVQLTHVGVNQGRIAVHGQAPSYYAKQLALEAVREVAAKLPLDLRIDVTPPTRRNHAENDPTLLRS